MKEVKKNFLQKKNMCHEAFNILGSTLQRLRVPTSPYRRTITQMPFATWFQIHRISFLYHQGRRTSSLPSGIRAEGAMCEAF